MSRSRKLVAGNWKMFNTRADGVKFLDAIAGEVESVGAELLLFPQSLIVADLVKHWRERGKGSLAFGVQNIYWEEKGAFTGELSPILVKEAGCGFALTGHSERRQFFGETNESAVRRALAAHKHGLKAVFCVGERLEERDAGRTFAVLEEQCAPLFKLAAKAPDDFVVAYEPVWAIGTGRTATAAQAEEAQAFLRKLLEGAWGSSGADCRILYGGSVKPENARELMAQPNIDGALVGGASLEAGSFLAIARAAEG